MKLNWKKLLTISTDIIGKVPTRGDGFLVTLVKILGIVDSFQKEIYGKKKSAALFDYFDGANLIEETNEQFVNLFFNTGLKDAFKINKLQINEYVDVVTATHDIGTLYFIECHYYSKPDYSSDFWHTKGFNFHKALGVLWNHFDGRIYLDIKEDRNGQLKTTYSKIPPIEDPLLGTNKFLLKEFTDQHYSYTKDKIQRTYLFCGKQGSGKTSFALRVSELIGNRTLRIDAQGITQIGAKDLDFIVDGLSPGFIIIDDIDRAADLEKSLPTLFAILADFKGKYSDVTIILTVNDLTKLDSALLRPGRIDEILDFNDPDEKDRREILSGYLKEFGIASLTDIDSIVMGTEGLTAAYLKEIALQLRYRSSEQIMKIVSRMNELAKPKADDKSVKEPKEK